MAKRGRSNRENARKIAAEVVSAYLADAAREDPMERALFDAMQRLDPNPAHELATNAESPVCAQFQRERLRRYEARECRQLGPREWEGETAEIVKAVQATLSRRYRDFLR